MLALYLVGRGAVEVVLVDRGRPQTYRQDWGGPHYVGVLLVHTGPGAGVLALSAVRLRRAVSTAARPRGVADEAR